MGGKKSAKPAAASSSSDDQRRSERKCPPLPKAAPWLVFPYQVKGNKQNQSFYNICEPNKKTCRKYISELSGKSYWQKHSYEGWLIDFGDCFLWNPASLETIQLPSLLHWYDKPYEYALLDCVLSSPPTTSTSTIAYPENSDDEPMVLLLFLLRGEDIISDDDKFLVFCHPGDNEWGAKWVLSEDMLDEFGIVYLCCFKGKLYLMSLGDRHLKIDKGKLWDDDDDSLIVGPFETTNNTGSPWRDCQDHIDSIIQIHFNKRQNMKVFNSVVVVRLDFSSMEWKAVTCLGDHVLFIGKNTRACCSASKLGLASGYLYYTFREDQGLYKFDVQSSRNSVILPCLKLPKPWLPSGWIMILDERQQEEEEEDCLGKAVENELSVIFCEKKENKDGGFQETSPWDILKAAILQCLPWFPSYWMGKNVKDGEETIPRDILNADSKELVASYLHPLDYVHFRSVGKTIRAMMPVLKPTFATTSITKTSYLFPWMMICRDNNDTVYNFFSELLLGATIRFQKGGWLLMSREEILFFYNLFTRETINLRHLPEHNLPIDFPPLPKHYFSSSICFCSLPTSTDCIVLAIDQCHLSNPRTITVYSITRGKQVWDIFNFDNTIRYMPLCNPPILHQGAFYRVDYNGLIGTFNLEDNTWKVPGTPRDRYTGTYPYPSFLVKSGEDLLLNPVMDWVEIDSLGKHMLFISRTSCLSAIAPNSQMENKIYFPRQCLNGDGILFYSLETGTYDSFGGWRENCTWIEPNWTKFTPQELNWFEPHF
ncbi:hypothetical protein MKX01_001004 [Papaver californicum]|nr:hypothetical protein MKX01_001004 [Papaver californicum]